MNKVEKELQDATDVTPKKGEDRGDYLRRMMKAIAALSEKEWDGLSKEAQDWYNANAEARNVAKKAGKDIPDPTDFEAEDEPPARRRANADEDDEPRGKGKAEAPSVDKLEEGQRVKITTKRDKVIEGEVVENKPKKDYLVVKTKAGDEVEVDYDKVAELEVFHGDAGKGDDKGGGKAEPEVGDQVVITTKRGKEIEATLVEITDDEITYEDADGKDDITRDRVESIKVVKKGAGAGKGSDKGGRSPKDEDEEPKARGGKGGKEAETEKDDGKRTRSSNEAGVSVGGKIKELIAENMDATEEEIGKLLKKAGIEFKENTLKLNFSDCHKFLAILKEKKLLKK